MTSYDLALMGVNKVLSCGCCIFIKIPLWAFRTYWKIQMLVLSVPYRCFQCLLRSLRSIIMGVVDPPIRAVTHEVLHEFLTNQNPKKNTRQTESPLATVRGVEASVGGFFPFKNKTELEKRIEEETCFANEEKKLLRMTVSALKCLKRFKGSKAVLDEQFRQTLEDLINISRSLSRKTELRETMEDSGFGENPRCAYSRRQKQADLLKDHSEKRQTGYFGASRTSPLKLTSTNEFINGHSLKQTAVSDSELVCISMEALQSVIYVLNAENFALKRRLKLTNDQLGGFKKTSKCLADKVSDLEVHLDKIKGLLKTTEEERDDMCLKLFALSRIIEEQETMLNDSSRINKVGALYNTTLDYLLSTEQDNFHLHAMNFDNVF